LRTTHYDPNAPTPSPDPDAYLPSELPLYEQRDKMAQMKVCTTRFISFWNCMMEVVEIGGKNVLKGTYISKIQGTSWNPFSHV
jgi:hypothetical protein